MIKWPWRRSPGSCSWKMWLGTKFLWVTSPTLKNPFLGNWGFVGWSLLGLPAVPHKCSGSLCWLSTRIIYYYHLLLLVIIFFYYYYHHLLLIEHWCTLIIFLQIHQPVPSRREKGKFSLNKPLNETNLSIPKKLCWEGWGIWKFVFNISKQRISKLTNHKTGSLTYYQPFLVYPGFPELSFSMEFLLKYLLLFPFSHR